MKKIISLALSLLFILTLATAAFANVEGTVQVKKINSYQVELITPNPLTEGEKEIEVKVTQNGSPLEGIPVKIKAEMDAKDDGHMKMEEMEPIEQEMENENDEYHTTIHFEGDGKWFLTVTLDNKDEAVFDVMVESSGPNWFVIGGFLGIICLVILVAALGRNKKQEGGASFEQ